MSVIRKRQLEGLLHQRKTAVMPEELLGLLMIREVWLGSEIRTQQILYCALHPAVKSDSHEMRQPSRCFEQGQRNTQINGTTIWYNAQRMTAIK